MVGVTTVQKQEENTPSTKIATLSIQASVYVYMAFIQSQ